MKSVKGVSGQNFVLCSYCRLSKETWSNLIVNDERQKRLDQNIVLNLIYQNNLDQVYARNKDCQRNTGPKCALIVYMERNSWSKRFPKCKLWNESWSNYVSNVDCEINFGQIMSRMHFVKGVLVKLRPE